MAFEELCGRPHNWDRGELSLEGDGQGSFVVRFMSGKITVTVV